MPNNGSVRVGIDVGGTFTDLVALQGERIVTAKVPSTPRDQSEGVIEALRRAGIDPREVGAIAHGTTVATNALLERNGARTALVTTEGFRDLLEIGRQNRASLYEPWRPHPPPLVPRELRFTVAERMGPEGELRELDEASLDAAVRAVADAGVEAVAVCFLFSFAHPEHERAAAESLRQKLGKVDVSSSSEVLPEFREYERFSTTVADAYLKPRLRHYLAALASALEGDGYPAPLVMQSSGGVIGAAEATERAAACVLSGPAGGVVGAAYVASRSGRGNVLSFDMGGTSTDVAAVSEGRVQTTTESTIAGVPIKLPMVDVHTVSAGGGSIAAVDEGGALVVGPGSAGADPGPACYGRGGTEPTVTDANLVLGYLGAGTPLGGEISLDAEAAGRVIKELAERAGLDPVEAAAGVVRVANAEMSRALRVISVGRGLDPRNFALVAFGGAGPMHACALAEELGVSTVLVPAASGMLSALGLVMSDVRRDAVRPVLAPAGDLSAAEVGQRFEEMEAELSDELEEAEMRRMADLRYAGQSFELTVDATDLDSMPGALSEAHRRRYGYSIDDAAVEVVNLRVAATVAVEAPEPSESPGEAAPEGERRAWFDGDWIATPLFARGDMGAEASLEGPAIVELSGSTCVVRPGWSATVDDSGTLVLQRAR